jgi:hypothetical protein
MTPATLTHLFRGYRREEIIPPNSALFVHGNGFLDYLLGSINIEHRNTETLDQYLHKQIESQIQSLRALSFQLNFFFDGSKARFKSAAKLQRLLKSREEWSSFKDLLTKANAFQELPLPTLSCEQLIVSLLALDIPISFCEGECQQDLARACKRSNDAKIPSFCYCDDR